MNSSSIYSHGFYVNRAELTRRSAAVILKLIWSITKPRSVLDLGCATGAWLRRCDELGCDDYLGIDGPWVDRALLEIPDERFMVHDFSSGDYVIDRRYDLSMSIEVAEHLTPVRGSALVETLVAASDLVLFSAAIPGQGGRGHVNEQLQSHWASNFKGHGFMPFDVVRPYIWDDPTVNVIYKQNLLLFANEAGLRQLSGIAPMLQKPYEIDRVHPELLQLVAGSPIRGRMHGVARGLNLACKSLLGQKG